MTELGQLFTSQSNSILHTISANFFFFETNTVDPKNDFFSIFKSKLNFGSVYFFLWKIEVVANFWWVWDQEIVNWSSLNVNQGCSRFESCVTEFTTVEAYFIRYMIIVYTLPNICKYSQVTIFVQKRRVRVFSWPCPLNGTTVRERKYNMYFLPIFIRNNMHNVCNGLYVDEINI